MTTSGRRARSVEAGPRARPPLHLVRGPVLPRSVCGAVRTATRSRTVDEFPQMFVRPSPRLPEDHAPQGGATGLVRRGRADVDASPVPAHRGELLAAADSCPTAPQLFRPAVGPGLLNEGGWFSTPPGVPDLGGVARTRGGFVAGPPLRPRAASVLIAGASRFGPGRWGVPRSGHRPRASALVRLLGTAAP